eukprot:3449277-Prymnesium_polylepis.1
MRARSSSTETTAGAKGGNGGNDGDAGGGGLAGGVGGEGGEGGASGETGQHSSQPVSVTPPSEVHVIVPRVATTPTGPLVPQYLVPSIQR